VVRLNEPIFGKLSEEDVFAVAADSSVGFATVQAASASAPAPTPLPVRKRSDGAAAAGVLGTDLRLSSMHFDRPAERVLLYYRADLGGAETFEIFDIQ
jgi:hypothetical protein